MPRQSKSPTRDARTRGICYPPTTRTIELVAVAEESGSKWTPASTTDWLPPPRLRRDADSGRNARVAGVTGLVSAASPSGGMVEGFSPAAACRRFGGLSRPWHAARLHPLRLPDVSHSRRDADPRRRASDGTARLLSLTYGLACVTAFGMLGPIAAWSGQNLQFALQSPVTIALTAMLFVVLALPALACSNCSCRRLLPGGSWAAKQTVPDRSAGRRRSVSLPP